MDIAQPSDERVPTHAELVHHAYPKDKYLLDTTCLRGLASSLDKSGILTPMIKVSLQEAERHLGELIEEAAAGQDVVITRASGPAVRLLLLSPDEAQKPPAAIGRALDRFIGTWSADQEAEVLKAVEVFEQVDPSFWQ